MSRSGYSDDIDNWQMIKWRGQVASSIRGKRGQHFLKDLLIALDEMPIKELIDGELECEDGSVCAIGSLGKKRGIDMKELDPEEPEDVAKVFNISRQLAAEVVYENDEYSYSETPEDRWKRMRAWVASKIIEVTP